jgi:hypothetical protein
MRLALATILLFGAGGITGYLLALYGVQQMIRDGELMTRADVHAAARRRRNA